LSPRPEHDVIFFQGMLEGIAAIETLAYARLAELGAPSVRRVISIGGGAGNAAWQKIRARYLKVPVTRVDDTEAAYGTARLALHRGAP
jgi:sugar (pentulose or hexulose) kinase